MAIIKRKKAEREDKVFSSKTPICEYTPINLLGLNLNGEQELTKAQRLERALTKKAQKQESKREKLIANNFGFTEYRIYELYHADMRGEHDVYRSIAMSSFWAHNKLWQRELDTLLDEYQSQALVFKPQNVLRKSSFVAIRACIRDWKAKIESNRIIDSSNTWLDAIAWHAMAIESMKQELNIDAELKECNWKDDNMFLIDAQTIGAKSIKTPCKSIELKSHIDLFTGEQVIIKCYALKAQYYTEYRLVNHNSRKELFTVRKIRKGERLESKNVDAFALCHVSRYTQELNSRPIINKSWLERKPKDNYLDWLRYEIQTMKLIRAGYEPKKHETSFTELLRKPKDVNAEYLSNLCAQVNYRNMRSYYKGNKTIVKPKPNTSLWKLAKSDELFLERFRSESLY